MANDRDANGKPRIGEAVQAPEGAPGSAREAETAGSAPAPEPLPPARPGFAGPESEAGPEAFDLPAEPALDPSAGREDGNEAGEDLLCFAIANEEYGIDIRRVWEIIRPRSITEIPRAPEFIRGIISLRGEIVPVLDLRRRLGFPPAEVVFPGERIVVAIHNERRIGMAVDAVSHKIRVSQDRITPPAALPGAQESGFLTGVCRHQGRLIAVLDADAVLGFHVDVAVIGGDNRRGAAAGSREARNTAGGAS